MTQLVEAAACPRPTRAWHGLLALLLLAATNIAAAGINVPTGAALRLGGGQLALGGGALNLGGTLEIAGGQLIGVSNLGSTPGSLLTVGSGLIELAGDWVIQGTFLAGSGTVRLIDSAAGISQLRGSNSFSSLSLISTLGKRIVLEPGSVQSISQLLTISGTAARPIQIERLPSGPVAEIKLLPGGTQSIAHVGVSNVHATGQPLAPLLRNEGGSGNAFGWFGLMFPSSIPVPAGSPFSLLMLLTLVVLTARTAMAGANSSRSGEV